MNSKSDETVKLFWILFVITILGLVSCDSTSKHLNNGKRKYLEVEDLRGFDVPARYASGEEITEIREDSPKAERPRKIERRSPRVDVASNNLQKTFNDTRSAIQQISQIVNESITDESIPQRQSMASLKMKATAAPGNGTESETPPATEEPEFKLTRPLLMSLVRRNVNGLVRLFNIEWRDAISQSQKNVKEFQHDLGKQVGMYLQDNPNNY